MRYLFLILLFSISFKCLSQKKTVFKFECSRVVKKDINSDTTSSSKYRLVVVDFEKKHIKIYPDDVIYDMYSEMKVTENPQTKVMASQVNCLDKVGNECSIILASYEGSFILMSVYYAPIRTTFYYYLNGEKQ